MWSFVNSMGHPSHFVGTFTNQKRDFSFHVPSVPIVPGKTFTNPNFVNKHHPSVHSYQNRFILTPNHKIRHADSSCVNNSKPLQTNSALVNSSQSIVDALKENHIDIISSVDQNSKEQEVAREPVMCNSRTRNKRNRKNKQGHMPGKSSKQNINRQQINDMMEIDLEMEPSINVSDISMSPKIQNNSFDLTDFIIEKPNKSKPIKINQIEYDSDEEIIATEISISPNISSMCMRERQVSIAESEDSFIIFDSGTDEELEFSDETEDESENEEGEDEVDFTSPIIPHKRVRFAEDNELCEIHPMVQWSFAYQQARKGPWEVYARDRDRFNRRIADAEIIMSPIFDAKHRDRVYQERFKDKIFAF